MPTLPRNALWALLLISVTSPAAAMAADLRDLLRRTPADSLLRPLASFEAQAAPLAEGIDATLALAALRFARGEYREAVTAYTRAAARLAPGRKVEARYWAGLSWLGLGEPTQARAALEEVARSASPRRREAAVGVALAWEMSGRPERALETLSPLLDEDLGEAGPAAFDRLAILADRAQRADLARRARERLLAAFPRSIEAAAARLALARGTEPGPGSATVIIGTFLDPARARALAAEARRAGFANAQVVSRGEGIAAVHVVRLGAYSSQGEARRIGEQAERALGVTVQIGRMP